MKQKIIGIYETGYEQVELILREGYGGEFYNIPEIGKNKLPRLKVGAEATKWEDIVAVLVHEIDEYVLTKLRCRFDRSLDISRDHAAYLFVLDHPTFSEKCARTGDFLAHAMPDLKKAWKKWKKKGAK